MLEPEEREALASSRMAVPQRTAADGSESLPSAEPESAADKAGKVGISVLGVALTAAAAAAPFFLF
jgi:hypothetical protein